jgi:putative PIN family toxin of toxin-antitoxin system
MVMRVVFDTNVYVSAILFGGIPKQLILHALEGKFQLNISDEILTEVAAVLIKKFEFTDKKVELTLKLLKEIALTVKPKKTLQVIKNWPADNRILECAIEAKADYLVSGDRKHILPLKKIGSVKIVPPKSFLDIL